MLDIQSFQTDALPENLSANIEPKQFLGLVYEAVQTVEWPRTAPGGEAPCPAMMRTLLAYCYAIGVYGSREIEYMARVDPTVRYICANEFPSWGTIRRFRRREMPWLKQALARLCELAAERARPAAREEYADWFMRRWEAPSAAEFSREADERLRRAMQADSMALDE